jgi:hypothetical protein
VPKHGWSGPHADLVEHALGQKKEFFATEEALLAFWEARDGRWLNDLERIQLKALIARRDELQATVWLLEEYVVEPARQFLRGRR